MQRVEHFCLGPIHRPRPLSWLGTCTESTTPWRHCTRLHDMLATESVRSSSGYRDVRTSGFSAAAAPATAVVSATCRCRVSSPGVDHFFLVLHCAHGPSWSQDCGPRGSGVVRGWSGYNEGPAAQLLPPPPSGLRPPAVANPTRAKRALGGTAAGGRGRCGLRPSRPWTADSVPPAAWPYCRPLPRPRSGWGRRAAERWGWQWQQPRGGACLGWPSREGGGRRLGGWRRCEPQPRREAHDPAGPDRVDGGERRGAGVLRRQDCQVRRSLHEPPGDLLARQCSVTWPCPLSSPTLGGACLRERCEDVLKACSAFGRI